jgi:hypothetical protein
MTGAVPQLLCDSADVNGEATVHRILLEQLTGKNKNVSGIVWR